MEADTLKQIHCILHRVLLKVWKEKVVGRRRGICVFLREATRIGLAII